METVETQWLIGLGLLTLASCVQPVQPTSIESKPIVATSKHANKDHHEGKAPNNGANNKEVAKNVLQPKSLKISGTTESAPPTVNIETFTVSDTKISIDPKTCTVEVDWKGQRFSETLEAVGPPNMMCMVSRRANSEIQEYLAERGTAIVVGSSSKPDNEGWCNVLFHGILITRSGPEISVSPQKPKICGVHKRDEILFALLAYETRPMKRGQ